jgi:hypothetical protein
VCRPYLALAPVAVLAWHFAGCNMNNEPRPIDHKDEPGDYRQKVREGVEKRVGMRGQPITRPDELVGSWDVAADTSFGELPPKPMFVYHLRADGSSIVETTVGGGTGGTHRDTGEWRLNRDGTFSLLTWCPPAPEFGIDEPQLEEDRRHVAALADGRLVMWNGDGSSLLVLSRKRSK